MKSWDYEKSFTDTKFPERYNRIWHAPVEQLLGFDAPLKFAFMGYGIWKKGGFFARDSYDWIGIELVISGNMVYETQGKHYLIGPDEVLLKTPGPAHRYETGPAGYVNKRFATIQGDGIRTLLMMFGLSSTVHIRIVNPREIIRILNQARTLICEQKPGYSIELSALCYKLLVILSSDAAAMKIPRPLMSALYLMRENLRGQLSTGAMAKAANTSVSNFYREFCAHMGMPPAKYFRRLKMEHAAHMLHYRHYRIKEIASVLGYEEPYRFTQHFKEFYGKTPRQFQREESAM
jgi:AraC-like DNA-binding protein